MSITPPPPVIVRARRTPFGRFMGALRKKSAVDLAIAAGREVMRDVPPEAVDQVIVGQVLGAGCGMNIARQIGVKLDLPIDVPAFTVNMMCASGMQAIRLACQAIRTGEASVVLCGGTESMSNAPYLLDKARSGYKLGDGQVVDSLLRDGLVDAFDGQHMGVTAERLAASHGITRDAQDALAVRSQQSYRSSGRAARLGVVNMPELDRDEHPRPETTADDLRQLKPVFDNTDAGTVTAGNASGINDGAAMLLIATPYAANRLGLEPLAQVDDSVTVGCDPATMGLGPVRATRQLLERVRVDLNEFQRIELNEAFAAQALACFQELELDPNDPRVNTHGGAIAVGHPIGATGARLITQLAHEVHDGSAYRALATLCVGGGMGAAMMVSGVE